jgi:hypothetical protein
MKNRKWHYIEGCTDCTPSNKAGWPCCFGLEMVSPKIPGMWSHLTVLGLLQQSNTWRWLHDRVWRLELWHHGVSRVDCKGLCQASPLAPGLKNHHPISAAIFVWCSPCVHVCVHVSPFIRTHHMGLGHTTPIPA